MKKHWFFGYVCLFLLTVATVAQADETLQQKLNGTWELVKTKNPEHEQEILKLDFQRFTFEEQTVYNEDFYKKELADNPEMARELLPTKISGTFKVIAEDGNTLTFDFFSDMGLSVTLEIQDDGRLNLLGGLALTTKAEAVKYKNLFFTYVPRKNNNGLDGVWVAPENDSAIIINQAKKPKPEMALLFADKNQTLKPDADGTGFDGNRVDGDLIIKGNSDGLIAARLENLRTRESLTLNADGTLSIKSHLTGENDVYIRVKEDQ